jgi:hypothetical protein
LMRWEAEAPHARAVAKHLVEFYARLRAKRIAAEAYRHSIDQHVRANGEALLVTRNPGAHNPVIRLHMNHH